MAGPGNKRGTKTIEDWLALPEDARIELIDGDFVEKAAPTFDHGLTQFRLSGDLRVFDRKPGGVGPNGWWFGTEVDILLDGRVFRPDIAGWRRERVPAPVKQRPVPLRPDWICEIVSDTHRTNDTVVKLTRYHQSGVPHYWILDQYEQKLTVHRHTADGYTVVLTSAAPARVRAEPFGEIELDIGALLGLDDLES